MASFKIWMLFLLVSFCSCDTPMEGKEKKDDSSSMVANPHLQETLFQALEMAVGRREPAPRWEDSLQILILPTEASCPACRKKTINSIAHYGAGLDKHQFIILEGKGRKSISGYFVMQGKSIPVSEQILLDTLGIVTKNALTEKNPATYYAAHRKVYRQVLCTPATIKHELIKFFKE
jgi:hypothetical protein